MRKNNESIDIFHRGIENERALGFSPSYFQSFLMIGFSLFLLLFGKYKPSNYRRVALVDSAGGKRIYPENLDCQYLYHAKALRFYQGFRSKLSFMTPVPWRKRVSIFFHILSSFIRVRSIKLLGYYAEFLLIQSFIDIAAPSFFAITATVDRRACWISSLMEKKKGLVVVYPHGTLIGLSCDSLPHRFRVDEINCWNNLEKEIYSRAVISNSDCLFHISKYKPSVAFHQYPTNHSSLSIGVFTQNDSSRYIKLVAEINKVLPDSLVVIMPHPLENIKDVSRQFEGLSVRIVPDEKYINFDIAITGNSTMIYDLFFSNYCGIIISYSEPNDFEKACPDIKCIQDSEDIVRFISELNKE